ncbi:glycerol-3-phosphate responsive antiterminator [Cohnella caldifontis]|uniref:glycerol-3-phosphate responsive antiterminator n=1 Tax=Cohnella caldifontis TaxID=3027471 RepID=UPI0023EC4C68|nr:glycerol-3-phosphate responsive antiterminator [Cohnella sp. YIM B05605]
MNRYPVIASLTSEEQIPQVLDSKLNRVNLMTGHIGKLEAIVNRLREADKQVYVHVEMVAGLGKDKFAIAYLAERFRVDGIITTKSNTVAAAKQAGLRSIQRIFAIDTAAVQTAVRVIGSMHPDEVELMPGLMPRVIREMREKISQPLIVGGLIRREEEISAALESGADYISCGDPSLW